MFAKSRCCKRTLIWLYIQILALKAANPGCILMFEVGYKMRFFGSDAQVRALPLMLLEHWQRAYSNWHFQIASKELGVACFPDRNFLTAYIPVHRKNVHLKK